MKALVEKYWNQTKVKAFNNKMFNKQIKTVQKKRGFPKFLIWYYRIIGITFGGIQFNQNNEIVSNKWLRYYGFLSTIVYSVIGLIAIYHKMNDHVHLSFYENGLKMTYYTMSWLMTMNVIQIVNNQISVNKYGIPMIEAIGKYGLGSFII